MAKAWHVADPGLYIYVAWDIRLNWLEVGNMSLFTFCCFQDLKSCVWGKICLFPHSLSFCPSMIVSEYILLISYSSARCYASHSALTLLLRTVWNQKAIPYRSLFWRSCYHCSICPAQMDLAIRGPDLQHSQKLPPSSLPTHFLATSAEVPAMHCGTDVFSEFERLHLSCWGHFQPVHLDHLTSLSSRWQLFAWNLIWNCSSSKNAGVCLLLPTFVSLKPSPESLSPVSLVLTSGCFKSYLLHGPCYRTFLLLRRTL